MSALRVVCVSLFLCSVTAVFGQQRGQPLSDEELDKLPPFERRTHTGDANLRKRYAISGAQENAISASIKWLSLHQRPDGSWSFDHRNGPCKSNPGSLTEAYNGATALALLPMLGVGQTHKEGEYKAAVKEGLAYLVSRMKMHPEMREAGDLADSGTMYSHGLATMALCEAYAQTKDRELMAPAQAAINYIKLAQDPTGGGWRYAAKQPGDTSVTGWQVQALYAASLSDLKIPDGTFKGAGTFLDKVQSLDGARYGYVTEGTGAATTAEGLYCRSLLDWNVRENKPLVDGMAFIVKTGPSKGNFYFNFYATQLLRHHMTGEWKAWNEQLCDDLIRSQAKEDAEKGSWYVAGDHGAAGGGRIYCTSMATLILENGYRSYGQK